jgi:hypothetical protein
MSRPEEPALRLNCRPRTEPSHRRLTACGHRGTQRYPRQVWDVSPLKFAITVAGFRVVCRIGQANRRQIPDERRRL